MSKRLRTTVVKVIMAQFQVLFQHFPGGPKENIKSLVAYGRIFNMGTPKYSYEAVITSWP